MPAEEVQEQGRAGALDVKRWLESTMRFDLPYDVYTNTVRTTLRRLDGSDKRFDLSGQHYDERYDNPRQIYVEVKNVTTDSGLSSEWLDFVASAYSATHHLWELGRDPELQFMFASTHAWSSSLYWKMTEPESVLAACKSRPDLMPEGGPDEGRVRTLTERLFLWVVSRRQDDMTMAKRFRGLVLAKIAEEES